MKSVLISIQPKWCELIANGKKTVEVRKTKPKLETPFKVYIYCTQGDNLNYLKLCPNKNKFWVDNNAFGGNVARANGKVIGEFVCDEIDTITKRGVGNSFDYCYLNLNEWGNDDIEIEILAIKKSCISKDELNLYGKNVYKLYAWHISNLVIYDKPRELYNFQRPCNNDCENCEYLDVAEVGSWEHTAIAKTCLNLITRPPQSWCYVESEVDNNG